MYAIAFAFSSSIIFFIYAGCFRFGAWLVNRGEMNAEEVFRFESLLFSCAQCSKFNLHKQNKLPSQAAGSSSLLLFWGHLSRSAFSCCCICESPAAAATKSRLGLTVFFFSYLCASIFCYLETRSGGSAQICNPTQLLSSAVFEKVPKNLNDRLGRRFLVCLFGQNPIWTQGQRAAFWAAAIFLMRRSCIRPRNGSLFFIRKKVA